MKHSCTHDLGIKMDSNKHGTMEQNEDHIMMNNLIYPTLKTEHHIWSYGMMNRA